MNNNDETISLDELFRLDRERRQKENPWTPADEARVAEKNRLERERNETWELAHPTEDEEEEEEEDES